MRNRDIAYPELLTNSVFREGFVVFIENLLCLFFFKLNCDSRFSLLRLIC